jgi:hypothetical protein
MDPSFSRGSRDRAVLWDAAARRRELSYLGALLAYPYGGRLLAKPAAIRLGLV